MAVDKEVKKKTTNDWLSAFPNISALAQNRLYKVIGCCIAGIEFVTLPGSEEYRPHFVLYPLWKTDMKKCLDAPIILKQLYNKKRIQFDIPFGKHSIYFPNAVECFKSQISVSLDGSVSLKSLFDFVNTLFNDMLVRTNAAEQAKLFELKFFLSRRVSRRFSGAVSAMNDIK